jgi:hypothetical protein
MRLNPLLIAEHAPDWRHVHQLATKHRRRVQIASLVTTFAVALVAILILSGNGGATPIIIVVAIAIIIICFSAVFANWEELRRSRILDIYAVIREEIGGEENYSDPKPQPAKHLSPGDLACSLDEWKQPEDREEDKQHLSLLRLVVATERTDDDRLRIGLADANGRVQAPRGEDWQYQMRRMKADSPALAKGAPVGLAAAIADLVEVVPADDSFPARQAKTLDEKVSDYLKRWPHLEALNAFMAARAAKLLEIKRNGDRATTIDGSVMRVIQDGERFLYPSPNTARLEFGDVTFNPPGPLPSAEVVARLFGISRLTPLGRLWRDGGRKARQERARETVMVGLAAATRERPAKLEGFPHKARAIGEHFLSYVDLESAIGSLERDGYIESGVIAGSLTAWRTAKGIAWQKEGFSMQERHDPHQDAKYNFTIGTMTGGTIGFGDNVNQVVAITQAEMSDLLQILQGIRTFRPHMKLDTAHEEELGEGLKRVDEEMAHKAPDGRRMAASLRVIRDVLKIAGETTLTAAIDGFLRKIGFPTDGH